MKNWQIITFLFALVIVAKSTSTQSQQLQQVCDFLAQQKNRYSTQYALDISSQRCSFCQYSSDSKDPSNFAQGCSSCPYYQNGQCSIGCSQNYISTPSNMCIPCPIGSTCCAGNNAQSDPNFVASVQSQTSNPKLNLQNLYQSLINYTGTRQVTCFKGYFATGHVCQKLPDGCAAMTVQSDYYYCNSCLPGYYLDSNNKCSQNCQALYIPAQGSPFMAQCSSCISATKCAACTSQQGYFYLEPQPSNNLSSQQSSQQNIQVCTECADDNCIDCSNGSQTCNQCAPYYYYDDDSKSCKICPSPSKYLTINIGQTKDYYSGCIDGNMQITSYAFNQSIPQTDVLQQSAPIPIVRLSSGTFSSCDRYCTQCNPTSANGTICTACMAGYYLDQTSPTKPVCTVCPSNSLICQWNPIMKQPQVLACNVNMNDLSPPYSKTYYLQLEFAVQNYGENFINYSPNKACVYNVNNCKEMLNQNDPTLRSLCASCYDQPSDFAVGASSSNQIPYMMTEGQTCRQCNFPGALTCVSDPFNKSELIIQECADGYRPTPQNNLCIPCSINLGCATCDDSGNCLSCNKQQRFTVISNNGNISSCKIPYSQAYLTQGCIDWGQGTSIPSVYNCLKCSPNYILQNGVTISTSQSKANLCMSCPLNCQSCNQNNRSQCLSCSPGYYLNKDSCVSIPAGCATFNANGPNGGSCKYCQYGYRLMNDQYCSLCYSSNTNSFSGGQWFDCPGAQCKSQQNDEPQSSSNPNIKFFSLVPVILLCLII
ncbi:hypothetical protein ABPG72_006361 [Tetrahymena utriculariae]